MNSELIQYKAYLMRVGIIKATAQAGSGHPTSCLSAVDLVAVLFFHTMRYDPQHVDNLYNDQFILSKGHAAPALYATLADAGYFSVNELKSLRKIGSMLQGHPDSKVPGVEASSGSLGQGLSIASGLALAAKVDNKTYRVFTLLGDCAATERYNKSEPVNIGAGFEISIKELVGLITRLTGFEGKIIWDMTKPDGQPMRRLDVSRAERVFGFRAMVGFVEGLRRMVEWHSNNSEMLKKIAC